MDMSRRDMTTYDIESEVINSETLNSEIVNSEIFNRYTFSRVHGGIHLSPFYFIRVGLFFFFFFLLSLVKYLEIRRVHRKMQKKGLIKYLHIQYENFSRANSFVSSELASLDKTQQNA